MRFAETPQGIALRRRIDTATSTWRRDGLTAVYNQARDYYDHTIHIPLTGQQRDVSFPTDKEISMSLEQALADNTAAVIALTAALAKGAPAATAGASTDAKAETKTTKPDAKTTKATKETKPAAPKNSREDVTAVVSEVKEKFGVEIARGLFQQYAEKLKDVPDDKLDALYDAAKEKLAEGDDEGSGDGL